MQNQEQYARNAIARAFQRTRPEHVALIGRFFERKRLGNVKEESIKNYAAWLARWSDKFPGDLKAVTKEQVSTFLGEARESWSPQSAYMAATLVKAFYQWLLMDEPRPKSFWDAFYAAKPECQDDQRPVTDPEFYLLLNAARSARDRLILMLLRRAGYRASELCALNVDGVEFDDEGGVWLRLPADGKRLKTGPRPVYSQDEDLVGMLRAHLRLHPQRTEPRAPLVTVENGKHKGDRLTNYHIRDVLLYTSLRAGVARHRPGKVHYVNPHLLRHTSVTGDARKGAPDAFLRKKYGWRPGSDMPSTYTHLNEDDLKDWERRGDPNAAPQAPKRPEPVPPQARAPPPAPATPAVRGLPDPQTLMATALLGITEVLKAQQRPHDPGPRRREDR